MTDSSLTPEEFELHVQDLRQRLQAFLERGEGSLPRLRKDAEEVYLLRSDYAEVFDRHPDLDGLVGEMLARREQRRFVAPGARTESPGCLLGWLVRRRGSKDRAR
jgi:hypothetical protein